jgi:hypothetical protein
MPTARFVARNLAAALLSGDWDENTLVRQGAEVFGRRPRWLRPLVRRVLAAFAAPARDADSLTAFVVGDAGFVRHALRPGDDPDRPLVRQLFWLPPALAPAAGPCAAWSVSALTSPAALADWLGLTPGQLDWYADRHGRNGRDGSDRLTHYTYRWVRKASGRLRLLEAPKPRLKAIQRRLLREVLAPVPPHDAAHGFRPGRSVLTYAAPHAGRRLVLRLDLRDFFPSIPASRVAALFRTLGYPRPVARLLTGLCTHGVPADVWPPSDCRDDWATRRRFATPHLPQGAPTSPALANLCAYRLDVRLAALAKAAGAVYTRYADDLAFSGDREFERGAARFWVTAARTALEEGFEVRMNKTRFMRPGVPQQLAGVVVNERPNVRRAEYDRLKAVLTNCVRHGPASQNRGEKADFRGHLLGRIA